MRGTDAIDQLQAVGVGGHDVGQDQIEAGLVLQQAQRRLRAEYGCRLTAKLLEERRHRFACRGLVLYEQNLAGFHAFPLRLVYRRALRFHQWG